jgi:hypothetical protein
MLERSCSVDEFWMQFEPLWQCELLATGPRRRWRHGESHPCEIMTLLIVFLTSHYRAFKAYYTEYVQQHLRGEFFIAALSVFSIINIALPLLLSDLDVRLIVTIVDVTIVDTGLCPSVVSGSQPAATPPTPPPPPPSPY